jgi:hypothetical protein
MCSFSGFYDHSTHLLHLLHGGQHYISNGQRDHDYIADTASSIHSFKQWEQWAPTGASPTIQGIPLVLIFKFLYNSILPFCIKMIEHICLSDPISYTADSSIGIINWRRGHSKRKALDTHVCEWQSGLP